MEISKLACPNCGSDLWRILRTGTDFGLKCEGCGRFVQIGREKFLRLVREVKEKPDT